MPTNAELLTNIEQEAVGRNQPAPDTEGMNNAQLAKVLKDLKAEPVAAKPVAAKPDLYKIGKGTSITRGGRIYATGEEVNPDWFTTDGLTTHLEKGNIVIVDA
jgi:hypothetical protein